MIFLVIVIVIILLAALRLSQRPPNTIKIDGPYKPRKTYIIHPTEFRRSKYVIPSKTTTSKVRFNDIVKVREFSNYETRDLETKINDYNCQ